MEPNGPPEPAQPPFARRLSDFLLSRKFMLAVGASVGAYSLARQGILSGHEWMLTQSVIAGMFKAANVMDKKFGGEG